MVDHDADVTTTLNSLDDGVARPAHEASDHLFVVLDASAPLRGPARHPLDGLNEVVIGRGELGAVRVARTLALNIPDRRASSRHARLVREGEGWLLEDLGSKNGTYLGGEPVQRARVGDGGIMEIGHTFLRLRRHLPAEPLVRRVRVGAAGLETLLPDLALRFDELARLAAIDAPVVILGETGTGKDVTARAYHELTGRSGPFVPVNCGALPASLLEAALFGHRRGAFSGAVGDAQGLVRAADGGTLFLDELGDLPASSQAALLRVIEAREVVPVGAAAPVRVDLRVCAATHRDIPSMVRRGEFRADLWARLAGHVIVLPPLRQRIEDIGLLLAAAIRRHAPERAERITLHREAARLLLARRFPLNTRELFNTIGRALALSNDDVIGPDVVTMDPHEVLEEASPGVVLGAQPGEPSAPRPDRAARRAQLELLLETHNGNVSEVARALGKARPLVYKWLHQVGLDPDRYRR